MKEKGHKLPKGCYLEFETEKGDKNWTYNAGYGEYDEKIEKMYMETKEMDEAMVDKKTENDFWVRMKWGDHCYSPKYKCKNKNLTPIGIDLDGSGAVEAIRGEFMIDITCSLNF